MEKQAKKSKKAATKKILPVKDLGMIFHGLPKEEQDKIIHYFNLHNAAIFLYQSLSEKGLDYVNAAIAYSVEYKEGASDKKSPKVENGDSGN